MSKSLTEYAEEQANVIAFTFPLGKQVNELQSSFSDVWFLVETFDPDKRINLFEKVRIHDLGVLQMPLEDLGKKVRSIVESQKVAFMLSYPHLATLFALRELDDIKLIVFDAHADCWRDYIDERICDLNFSDDVKSDLNDATWLRRYAEEKGGRNVFCIGLRSFSEEEMHFMQSKGIYYATANDVKQRIQVVRSALWQFTEDSRVYISLDIDVFDPAVAPAVHYPEPNGIFFEHFQQLIQDFNGRLIGTDLCCLKPMGENKVTEFLAARSVKEILSKIKM